MFHISNESWEKVLLFNINVLRLFYSVLFLRTKYLMHLIFHLCCFNFVSFYVRGTIFCDRHPLMEVFHNVSGISFKLSRKRDIVLFVVHFKIHWSYLTKFSIEQEPLNILQICDTFIFFILQRNHMAKTT